MPALQVSDIVEVALIGSVGPIVVAFIAGGVSVYLARLARQDAAASKRESAENKEALKRVEDGITHALTAKSAELGVAQGHAAGMQDGREQMRADIQPSTIVDRREP
jgi:hypothetical protein